MSGLLPKAGTGGSGTVAAGNFTDLTVANNAIIGGSEIVGGALTVYGMATVGGLSAATLSAATLTATATTNQINLGNTAAQYTILSAPAPSATHTVTFPDVGANSSAVLTAGAQTIGGAKTLTGALAANGGITSTASISTTSTINAASATISAAPLSTAVLLGVNNTSTTFGSSGVISIAGSSNGGTFPSTITVDDSGLLTINSGNANFSLANQGSVRIAMNSTAVTVGPPLSLVAGGSLATGTTLTMTGTANIAMGTGSVVTGGAISAATIAAGFVLGTNAATTYTPVLGDSNSLILSTNAATQTITIPTNASVAYPIGTQISFSQAGAGKVTLAPAGGVTLNSFSSFLSTAGANAIISVIKTATNVWLVTGNLAT